MSVIHRSQMKPADISTLQSSEHASDTNAGHTSRHLPPRVCCKLFHFSFQQPLSDSSAEFELSKKITSGLKKSRPTSESYNGTNTEITVMFSSFVTV